MCEITENEIRETTEYLYCTIVVHRNMKGKLLYKEQFGSKKNPNYYARFME